MLRRSAGVGDARGHTHAPAAQRRRLSHCRDETFAAGRLGARRPVVTTGRRHDFAAATTKCEAILLRCRLTSMNWRDGMAVAAKGRMRSAVAVIFGVLVVLATLAAPTNERTLVRDQPSCPAWWRACARPWIMLGERDDPAARDTRRRLSEGCQVILARAIVSCPSWPSTALTLKHPG